MSVSQLFSGRWTPSQPGGDFRGGLKHHPKEHQGWMDEGDQGGVTGTGK